VVGLRGLELLAGWGLDRDLFILAVSIVCQAQCWALGDPYWGRRAKIILIL
jgi:hypothetical protein